MSTTIDIQALFDSELGIQQPNEATLQLAQELILEHVKCKKILLKAFVAAHGGKVRKKKNKSNQTNGEQL